jgi:hypothetical protein
MFMIRLAVLVSLWLLAAESGGRAAAQAAPAPAPPPALRGSILLVPAADGDAADRERVHARVRQYLDAVVRPGRAVPRDVLVVMVDAAGQPILPDLRRARSRGAAAKARDANALAFTFDSPTNPWTADDIAFLQSALSDFYPVVRQLFGPPAFDIVVNVRKDPGLAFAGFYDVSSNEMTLRSATRATVDVLCHELFHAFRDDYIIGLASYEEGMARAGEIEAFNRVPGYVHPFDQAHGYTYDVYYEALNRPVIGAAGGNLNDGYVSLLLRYQLAGFAWGKALIENGRFLERFNRTYYDAVVADPAVRFTESSLRQIAKSAQKRVEGLRFDDWYARQHVLNTAPPAGFALYQRVDNFVIDALQREAFGPVTMIAGILVDWRVIGYDGTVLDAGSGLTAANGHLAFTPALPGGYVGRLEVRAAAFAPDGQPFQDVVYRPFIATVTGEAGVFGVATGHNEGTVVINSLDRPRGRIATPLVNGAFSVPALETSRGRFVARLYVGGRLEAVREFTKDASRYLVVF